MASKPILFNTEMVRAILEGRKTQTRRTIPAQPDRPDIGFKLAKTSSGKVIAGFYREIPMLDPANRTPFGAFQEPRYQPGDVLWVRETWKQYTTGTAGPSLIDGYLYRADEPQDTTGMMVEDRWHPSIHMPKKAARLFLRVTSVRVERLQEMKMSDMQAEGVIPATVTGGAWQQWQHDFMKPAWNSTIKKPDLPRYGWDANPWVWVYGFERVKGEKE